MATNERLSDAEVARRAAEARRLRDLERGRADRYGGAIGAIERSQAEHNMGRGHDAGFDTVIGGLLQGLGLQWGDELLGGARDFHADYARNPALYDAASMAGMNVLGTVLTRIPLRGRAKLFNEARDLLAGEGVAQRNIPRPDRAPGLDGFIPFADRRFEASLPYVPPQNDINLLHQRGNAYDANRLTQERGDALGQAEDLLAQRRQSLDNYASLDAALHGALIGSGGVEPGDTPAPERLTGGILGALGASALTRGSSELKDLSGIPMRGARWSAQDVVDLPGPASSQPDVEDFFKRARMFEEQAFRDRTHDTFLGRGAGPSPTMRENPFVAPINDSNAIIRTAIAKANASAPGAELANRRNDEIAISQALEHYGGMRAPQPAPMGPSTLPPHVAANMPAAVREDPMIRPDALRTVMGDQRYFPNPALGEKGVDPALRSERQVDDLARKRVSGRQYPGFDPGQRLELAHLVANDAFAQAQRLAQMPRAKQPAEARRLLHQLNDPHFKRMMVALQLRSGQTTPVLKSMMELQGNLERIASFGTDSAAVTRGFDRGGTRGVEAPVAETAHALSQYPMSKRMAEALLDEPTLMQPREAYWTNPADRGDHPLVQIRRESVRPPWPYRAPASVGTQLAADYLALLADHAQHAGWQAARAQ